MFLKWVWNKDKWEWTETRQKVIMGSYYYFDQACIHGRERASLMTSRIKKRPKSSSLVYIMKLEWEIPWWNQRRAEVSVITGMQSPLIYLQDRVNALEVLNDLTKWSEGQICLIIENVRIYVTDMQLQCMKNFWEIYKNTGNETWQMYI